MNVTDDLEPKPLNPEWLKAPFDFAVGLTLNEGSYKLSHPDSSTDAIVVPTGSSLTIWTQSTIERV